ncbi:MAG: 1-(5-phosphoribosyl)-5-[(5-phosphoribosylamino)methylideneamino]imidazole-4-carboxamide isomerase [bacterium]
MLVIPAIDLMGGRCVRLLQGDYSKRTVYSDEPGEVARRWRDSGARLIHVVDLDGAKSGRPQNLFAISEIVRAVDTPIEVGGGIRDIDAIEEVLGLGARRVILGTSAVESLNILRKARDRFGERVVVGIDARDGFVAVRGWTEVTNLKATDLALRVGECGIETIIYTDIRRDGTLLGPNFEAIREIARTSGLNVIASGGVSSLDDIRKLKGMEPEGVVGAIVGKALYDGRVDLKEAISIAEGDVIIQRESR